MPNNQTPNDRSTKNQNNLNTPSSQKKRLQAMGLLTVNISSIDELTNYEQIRVHVHVGKGKKRWVRGEVVDAFVHTSVRYVRFDPEFSVPLSSYPVTDIMRVNPIPIKNAGHHQPKNQSSVDEEVEDTTPNKVAMQAETSPLKPENVAETSPLKPENVRLENNDIADNKASDTFDGDTKMEDAQLDVIAEEDTADDEIEESLDDIRETTQNLM